MKQLKHILRILYNKIIRWIGGLFFDKRYLTSQFFRTTNYGSKWILNGIFWQKIMRINSHVPWPISPFNTVNGKAENIIFHPCSIDNFQGKGVYYQCFYNKIYIGKGTLIANNVGLITANHNPMNVQEHLQGKDIVIGEGCWIGMNVVILPGVVLGDQVIS